jgi:hypothetical protein
MRTAYGSHRRGVNVASPSPQERILHSEIVVFPNPYGIDSINEMMSLRL